MSDIFFEPFEVDPISRSLIELVFKWHAAGSPYEYHVPAVEGVRFSITTTMKSADGTYLLPELKKECLQPKPAGPGVWWSLPRSMGHPLEVLRDVLSELEVKCGAHD